MLTQENIKIPSGITIDSMTEEASTVMPITRKVQSNLVLAQISLLPSKNYRKKPMKISPLQYVFCHHNQSHGYLLVNRIMTFIKQAA